MAYKMNFIPLESDPTIFTELMHDLGVSTSLEFVDVWSLEDDMVAIIPRPALALILILPPCPTYEQQQDARKTSTRNEEGGPIWLKQTIDNACGLYAILHSVCNIPGIIKPGTILGRLVESRDRTGFLETSEDIENANAKAALQGCSEAPSAHDEVDHHYISLVKRSNRLYVLDGEMQGPIDRGSLEDGEDALSLKGLNVVREYTSSDVEGMFSLLALVKS